MTETETLEVKEIVKLKEDDEGLSSGSDLVTEGQIEATVGDNDVAALVDEAQNICAEEVAPTEEMMDTAEPVTNHEETCEDKATEEPQDEAPKEAAAASQESMEVDDEPSSSEVKEKVTEPEPERISTTPPPSSPPSEAAPEEKSHIPNDGNNNTEDNESNATIPSNTNGDSNNATCDQNSTSTTSTQSVLQEEPTPGPLQMPEEVKNSEEAQTPSNCTTTTTTVTTSSCTESMSEVLTTSAPGSCMLKSVVDTTIHDLATSLSLTSSSPPASSLTSSSTSLSPGQGPQPNGSQGLPMLVKPPKTDVLLQTAREVLQLRDEPSGVLIGETRDNPVQLSQ